MIRTREFGETRLDNFKLSTPVKTTVWSRLVRELADDIVTSFNVTINYSEFCEANIDLRLRNIESRLLR